MAPSTSRATSTSSSSTQIFPVQIHNPVPSSTTTSTTTTTTSSGSSSSNNQTRFHMPSTASPPVLHLRGAPGTGAEAAARNGSGSSSHRRIQWATSVVDNEGLGRKKSKVCCIYHAPRGVDESSDESSDGSDSGDDSSSSSGGDDGAARMSNGAGGRGKRRCGHAHGHEHGNGHGGRSGKGNGRDRSPNAYEKVPRRRDGKGKGETG